nr:aminoglycoside phosphotransferase family protein [Planosporangium mesophilum]
MPSIVDWLRHRLEDDHLTDLRPGATIAPAHERRVALDVLDQLAADLRPNLCHGDVQPGNMLAGGGERWKLIDPRGMAGETAYDVAVLTIKIALYAASKELVARVSGLADLDSERVAAWITVASTARV